jgi:hypothetical protein
VNKNALSSKELKELIHANVNKVEMYENFLLQMDKNVEAFMTKIYFKDRRNPES